MSDCKMRINPITVFLFLLNEQGWKGKFMEVRRAPKFARSEKN